MKNTKKGFTLVELLVVIAILAILASVAVVGYSAFLDNARNSNAKTELHQIVTYVNAELMDDGEWKTGTYVVKYNADKTGFVVTGGTEGDDIADVINACPDFADLKGEVTLKANTTKTLVYTLTEGGSAEATLD